MKDEEIKEIDDDEFFEQIEEETLDDDMETSGNEVDDEPAVLEEEDKKPEEIKKEEDVPEKKRNNNHKKHKEEKKVPQKKENHTEKKEKHHESSSKPKKEKNNIWLWILGAVVIIALIAVAVGINNNWFAKKSVTLKDNVLANVNGEDITEMELETQYNRLPAQAKMLITKDNLLDQMIDEKLLIQDAKKNGVSITDEKVDQFLTETVAGAGLSMDEFEKGILDKNITLDEVKVFFKNQLIVTELLNKTILMKIEVTDKEIEDYFNVNKATFAVGETVLASHILVETTEEAQTVLDKIKAGEDFGDLAVEYSIDPSAKQYNGSLGWFGKGEMVKEFEDATFALKAGEIAGPVKTQFGYHIIKVFDKKEAGQLTLAEVKEDVKQELTYNKQKDMYADYIKNLREGAKIIKKQGTTAVGNETTTITPTVPEVKLTAEEKLAQCLTDKGAKLYAASWCGHCKTQKELFGDALKDLTTVECATADNGWSAECTDAGVSAVPTWYIGGKMSPGKKELSDLAKLAGCEYKK